VPDRSPTQHYRDDLFAEDELSTASWPHDILAAVTAAAQSPSGELPSNRKGSESKQSESELSEAVGAPLLRPYSIVNDEQS
jgi:hypothetical protein